MVNVLYYIEVTVPSWPCWCHQVFWILQGFQCLVCQSVGRGGGFSLRRSRQSEQSFHLYGDILQPSEWWCYDTPCTISITYQGASMWRWSPRWIFGSRRNNHPLTPLYCLDTSNIQSQIFFWNISIIYTHVHMLIRKYDCPNPLFLNRITRALFFGWCQIVGVPTNLYFPWNTTVPIKGWGGEGGGKPFIAGKYCEQCNNISSHF